MDKKQFQLIKQYVGIGFIKYILNVIELDNNSSFDELNFQPVQIKILDDIYSQIEQCRLLFVKQGSFGDGVELYFNKVTTNGASIFNKYREICGGELISSSSSDPVVSFLQNICIREYPNLLINSSLISNISPMNKIYLPLSDYNDFIPLVKNDILDKLTNKKENYNYAFQFSTSDGLEFNLKVVDACSSIIVRSFYDSCNRMDYSLISVLDAIEKNVAILRKLADGKEATYSSFIGVRGLRFQGFNKIEFSDSILRQFDDKMNPSLHTKQTIMNHNDEKGKLSGQILEAYHSTKIISTNGEVNTGNSLEANKAQEEKLQKLQFATVFSSLADHGPIPTFFEIGFPLVLPGNYSYGYSFPRNYILINEDTKSSMIKWYEVLQNKDLTTIQTPLKRLKYAIFERKNPEDAIVDAIIAWEGMFSEAFETTLKVTGSISKFLASGSEREELYERLKKLYSLRNALVHGRESKLLKRENIEDIRTEVINIGLECLIKLIENDQLLSMKSSERIKAILIMDQTEND